MENKIVQSLWIGASLSKMEQLSINSFLKNGHEFHLYTYGEVDNIPPGVIQMDANRIIPKACIFKVRDGYSSFSDFFRWKVVRDCGGWWVDCDTVCLKPFDFPEPYVFVGGHGKPGSDDCVSSGMFTAPKNSPVMNWLWDKCVEMDPNDMPWGEAGPPLITKAVLHFGLGHFIRPGIEFFPIFYTRAPQVFISNSPQAAILTSGEITALSQARSLHLFNEMWRLAGIDKDANYSSHSIYDELQRKYL